MITDTEGNHHRPGPWAVHRLFGAYVVPLADQDKPIGASERPEDAEVYAHIIHCGWYDGKVRSEEARANARLIAAAPDLLAACEQLLAWYGMPRDEQDDIEYRREVIVKAMRQAVDQATREKVNR